MLSRLFRATVLRSMSTSASTPKRPAPVDGRSFRLALVQLGGCTPSKATNLERARNLVLKAAKGKDGDGAVDMIVLPECFNSLYGAGKHVAPRHAGCRHAVEPDLVELRVSMLLNHRALRHLCGTNYRRNW